MFEQSLFEQDMPAEPSRPGDLFYDYEIKGWEFGPHIYKILAISAFVNLLFVGTVSQTSLLTMKGCDSPFVGRVCEVLDTVYVGTMIFGTQREYVDEVYEKTDLSDADVTFVNMTGDTGPLEYPEGYFQVANPMQYSMLQQPMDNPVFPTPDMSGFPPNISIAPPSRGGTLLDTKPIRPRYNPNVVQGTLPKIGGSTVASNGKKGSNANDIDDNAPTEKKPAASPEPTPMPDPVAAAVEINKKPLVDFGDSVATKWAAKEVDLNQPFSIVLNAFLDKDGKLDPKKSKFDPTKQTGDPKIGEVAKSALAALAESGYLTYLHSLAVDQMTVTVAQDDKQITVSISSAQKTPERAKTISSGINGYISIGKITAKNPSDERTLLDGASVTADGKNFVLNFALPKPVAQEMITRKLKEAQAKKADQPQPSSQSLPKSGDDLAVK